MSLSVFRPQCDNTLLQLILPFLVFMVHAVSLRSVSKYCILHLHTNDLESVTNKTVFHNIDTALTWNALFLFYVEKQLHGSNLLSLVVVKKTDIKCAPTPLRGVQNKEKN